MAAQEKMKYTKYEVARLIGSRATQIAQGAPLLIKLSKEDLENLSYNPIQIARKEFDEGVIPLSVERPLPEKKEIKGE
jgi:DNA-directed RNA polymerase subunit K